MTAVPKHFFRQSAVLPYRWSDDQLEILRISNDVGQRPAPRVERVRAGREPQRHARAIEALQAAARSEDNMVPPMMEAVRAEATVGE